MSQPELSLQTIEPTLQLLSAHRCSSVTLRVLCSVTRLKPVTLDGPWREIDSLVTVIGSFLEAGCRRYRLSAITSDGFRIEGGWKGGRASFDGNMIKWADGGVYVRADSQPAGILDGCWQPQCSAVTITGNKLSAAGRSYKLSCVEATTFRVEGGFRGGTAQWGPHMIKWADGSSMVRQQQQVAAKGHGVESDSLKPQHASHAARSLDSLWAAAGGKE